MRLSIGNEAKHSHAIAVVVHIADIHSRCHGIGLPWRYVAFPYVATDAGDDLFDRPCCNDAAIAHDEDFISDILHV